MAKFLLTSVRITMVTQLPKIINRTNILTEVLPSANYNILAVYRVTHANLSSKGGAVPVFCHGLMSQCSLLTVFPHFAFSDYIYSFLPYFSEFSFFSLPNIFSVTTASFWFCSYFSYLFCFHFLFYISCQLLFF